MSERILVAVAWPYANGSIHIGQVAGAYLPADIFARYHRMKGNDVLMVSGSDAHGTPVTLTAEQRGVTPGEVSGHYQAEFEDNWERLGISFDLFTTTHTDNHAEVAQDIFSRLHEKGHIYKDSMEMPYCEADRRFLADRYIEGKCPHCAFDGARGDQCDNCGRTLDPKDLLDVACRICGNTPVFTETEHFFIRLTAFEERLMEWTRQQAHWKSNVKNFTVAFPRGRTSRPRHHARHRLGRAIAAGRLRRQAHIRVVRGRYRLPLRVHRVGTEDRRSRPLEKLLAGGLPRLLLHGQGQHPLPHDNLARPADRLRRPETCPTTFLPTST